MNTIRSWRDLKEVLIISILSLFVIIAGERLGWERWALWKPWGDNLIHAAKRMDIGAVRQHLIDETDVNTKDEKGWTALHHSVLLADNETVMILIDNGADVNAKDEKNDKTPLDMAVQQQIIDLLRKHGGKTAEELKAEGK